MSDPSSSVIAEMEAAFALPALEPTVRTERSPERFEFTDSDWAVALFEHPGH